LGVEGGHGREGVLRRGVQVETVEARVWWLYDEDEEVVDGALEDAELEVLVAD